MSQKTAFVEQYERGRWRQVSGATVEQLTPRRYRIGLPYDSRVPVVLDEYANVRLRIAGAREVIRVLSTTVDELRVVALVQT